MGALDGKTAVVTGGGQGIGLGISEALAAAGAEILVAQRSRPPAELGAHWVEADLSGTDSPAAIADAVERHWGRLDILVNNAGFMFETSLSALALDDWNRMLAVNLTAPVFVTQALLPKLRDSGGSIVNIGSIEGLAANPGHIAYCATKGGVHALTRAMAVDLGAQGIRVNAIAPGWIRSELSDNYINAQADPDAAWEDLHRMHPVGRVGEPADVGQLAVYLAGDHAAFVTGQVIVIDGGRTSKLPLPF
ncbi:MAG TPA: SDR family oxidoreductase [Gammaproteobacteria bacterium]|jgi:meso-butanediol dehydrogenase/(S,S)-butanediol dehydrogenase/diacetyl reductase